MSTKTEKAVENMDQGVEDEEPNEATSGADNSVIMSDEEEPEEINSGPIMKIPSEVWVFILSQLSQKELVQARTVWKKFRQVVDNHFDFSIIVHDGKTDLNRVYQLRIRDCLITRLFTDVDLFQFPALIRRIRFWGPIHADCFQRIMNQVTGVEELSLTKFALMQDNLVRRERLIGFSKIKKLELLGYMCKEESRVVAKNATTIFSYAMPDLERLTVNFHCDITSINEIAVAFLDFVSRHNKLQNLLVSLVPEANHPNESSATRTTTVVIPQSVENQMRNVQLTSLRITTATKDLSIWAALLNSQTRLQDLRLHLSEGGLMTTHTTYVIGVPFDLVKMTLKRNDKTLTSVELKDLRLTPVAGSLLDAIPIDASVFRYASNLKRLILHRNADDYRRFPQYPHQPNIINLNLLPESIEVLEISRFYCCSDELQFVVGMLENLKSIVLNYTGSLNRLGVHGGIVESIASKEYIQTMNLTPLNYHSADENKKYDLIKAKYQMNDGDQLYFDFERYRNGLPQPRPPTSVTVVPQSSVVVPPSPEPSRPSRVNPSIGPRFFHRRFSSRLDSACGRLKTRAVYSTCRRKLTRELFNFTPILQPSAAEVPKPHWKPQTDLKPLSSLPPTTSSTTNDSLSGLFHSLDLHVTEEQKYMTETDENGPSTSSSMHSNRSEPRRQRRWSGDEVLHKVLKK